MTIKMWQQGCDDAKAGQKQLIYCDRSYVNGYTFGLQQRRDAENVPGLVARWLQELDAQARLLRTSDPVGSSLYAQRATVLRDLTRQA